MCLVEMATRVALAVRTSQHRAALGGEGGRGRRQQGNRGRVFMALAASAAGLAVVSENTSRDENNEKGK